MRVFALLALSVSALLATTTSQAHTQPVSHKLQLATLTVPVTVEVAALASPTTGPTAHASFSAPHVSTSFHSTPSYHAYSATPSRSFTFRSNSPSISTRPATTTRTYNYSVPRSAPAAPTVVHHYHNGGGGGMSATDYLVLNSIVNGQNQVSNDSGNNVRLVSAYQDTSAASAADDSLSGWQLAGIALVVSGLAYGLYRYLDSD